MVGKYLDGLTKEQEDRILTGKLGKAPKYFREDGCRCVRGWGDNIGSQSDYAFMDEAAVFVERPDGRLADETALRFDALCDRVGEVLAADLVRSRILVNQLKRSLAVVRATAGV